MLVTVLILLFLLIANLPWFSERVFLIYPLMTDKSVVLRLVEMGVYYIVALLIAMVFETRFSGEVYPQNWVFFVVTLCLFVVLAVPGVVYRYQWLPMQQKSNFNECE